MSRIVSVHSFRGGTGKSNLSANLAAIIAQQGNRVGVIDTDIQSPGIHVLFGLDEDTMSKSLNDYLWGKCPIEETAYDVSSILGAGASAGAGLYLIPSSIKAGEIARILRENYDVNMLNDGFRDLVDRMNLNYLLIDTHPGLNEETLLSIAISDMLVIILRPDQQDYQGTAVTVDVARRLDVPNMVLVVNKVLSSFDPQTVRQEVERNYGATVAGVLPLTEDLIRLGSRDVFCLRFPDHPWTKRVQEIAAQLMA